MGSNCFKKNFQLRRKIHVTTIFGILVQIELFYPCWPVNCEDDTDLTKNDLPWQQPQLDLKIRLSYDVYSGMAKSNELIVWMLGALKLHVKDDPIGKDNSLACLFALKIDEQGKYVADSFTLSSFIWAICQLIDAGSLSEKLDESELETLQQKINNWLLQENDDAKNVPISPKYLRYILRMCVCVAKFPALMCDAP